MSETKINSIFDLEEYKELGPVYQARRDRFVANWNHYKANSYKLGGGFNSDIGKYVAKRIADSIRPVFTPLARAVNLDVSLIPGDWPMADQAHQPAWDIVARASRWDVEGDLFTRFVTSMGEAGLWVVDDRTNGRLYLQALRPDSYVTRATNKFNKTVALAILISSTTDADGKEAEAAMVITPSTISTYVNGQLAPMYGEKATYSNELGYVPMVECKNDPGDGWGEPTFDDAVASLNQVNLQATYLGNIIQKHAEPQWAAFGAEKGDLEKSGDAIWFFPEGSDVKAILAAVDFPGVLSFIQEMKTEVKESLPELSLSELIGQNRVATDTVEIQMTEAVSKIRRLRKPIDLALSDALRMVGMAADTMGMAELTVLNDPALSVDKARPVIPMDTLMRLQIEQAHQSTQLSNIALQREKLVADGGEGAGDA